MTTDSGARVGEERSLPNVRILLDVDGVLNAVCKRPDPDQWAAWKQAECMGYTIRYAPEVGRRLGALAATEGVELRWLTTWEHDANVWIGPLFGWPNALVMDRHDLAQQGWGGLIVATSTWWKYDEAKALYEADGVPFVWVDDDLGDNHDDGAAEWVRSLGDQALGIRPATDKGLTDSDLTAVEAFVATVLSGSNREKT